MDKFYQGFCKETFDANGVLTAFEPVCPPGFNFAYDVVDEIALRDPSRRALVWCNEQGEERIFSFGELKELSDRAAAVFARDGVKKGDRVMLILKRHYQFWFVVTALMKLGAVIIPATNLLTKKDLVYRFEAAGVTTVVCTGDGEVSGYVLDACKECPQVTLRYMARGQKDGFQDLDAAVAASDGVFSRPKSASDDPMLLYFTSGTTGYPKMVIHDNTYAIGHIITAKHWQNIPSDGLHLTVSETGWGKAVWGKLFGQWILGASVFVYDFDKFSAATLLHMIEKYRITSFCAPPTIYRFFIKEGMDGYDLGSLKYATVAGEALNPEVYNRFRDYTGLKLMEGFGQTETTLLIANLCGMEPKPGSMGKPSPLFDVDLVDEDGKTVTAGEVGEIVVRTTDKKQVGLFMGYYRNESLTKEAWHDNLYHTGDTAWRDEDGYFWYVGRTDDVIKASGYRIGPFEIESVLMEHPSVLECAVTGAPDPVRGQVVKATIVLTKSYAPSEELAKELQEYVKNQTAPYKYPRIVEFVTELPKTISGKIRRVQIREESSRQQEAKQ